MQVRAFPLEKITPGTILTLRSSLSPVVRLKRKWHLKDKNRPNSPSEIDAFLAHLNYCEREDLTPESREEVYQRWLQRRLEDRHMEVLSLSIQEFSLERFTRRTQAPPRKSILMTRPLIKCEATVRFNDVNDLPRVLERGLTPREGTFGLGMITLHKPA